MKTLEDYIPKEALREVVKVLEFGEKTHGDTWKEQSIFDHIDHANTHATEFGVFDKESNLHNLAHAACRILFALAVEMEALRRLKDDSK